MKVRLNESELREYVRGIIAEEMEESMGEGFLSGFFGGKQSQKDKAKAQETGMRAKEGFNKFKQGVSDATKNAANAVKKTANDFGNSVKQRYNDGRNAHLADKLEKQWAKVQATLNAVGEANPSRTFRSQLSGVNKGVLSLIDSLRNSEEGFGYTEE